VSVVVRDATVRCQKRHGPLWVNLVRLSGRYLRERAGEGLDRGKSRVCLCPVAIKQVKVDISARSVELGRINKEQDGLYVAIAKGKKQDTVKDKAKCDNGEAVAQERFHPTAQGNWGRRSSGDVCHKSVNYGWDTLASERPEPLTSSPLSPRGKGWYSRRNHMERTASHGDHATYNRASTAKEVRGGDSVCQIDRLGYPGLAFRNGRLADKGKKGGSGSGISPSVHQRSIREVHVRRLSNTAGIKPDLV
jgi:hypothetical protein